MSRGPLGHALLSAFLAGCLPVAEAPPDSRVVQYDAGAGVLRCAPTGSRPLGQHCQCAADCAGESSTCLTEETSWFPQGLCATSCLGGAPCGTGFVCRDIVCYPACQANQDCPPQAHCVLGACIPSCTSDEDCLSGYCNRYNGRCLVAGTTAKGLGLDAPCTSDSQCRSEICIGGHCATPCSVELGQCPESGVCARVQGDVGLCLAPCTPPGPCPSADRRCASLHAGAPPACLPTTSTGCYGRTPSPTAGSACGCDADCDSGSRCLTEAAAGFPQGLCAAVCKDDSGCPATHHCFGGLCLKRCVVDDACGLGRLCGFDICYPYCVTDAECVNGTCDRYSGQCKASATSGGGVGATCTGNSACKSGLCDKFHLDGSCATYCSLERGACPDQALCVRATADGDVGFCARVCQSATDCPQVGAACVPTGAGLPNHCQ